MLTADEVRLRDGANGMIRVRAKTISGEAWQPKTKGNRAVPISRTLRPYLDRYMPRPFNAGWYFLSPECSRWDADNFSADLRDANAALVPEAMAGEMEFLDSAPASGRYRKSAPLAQKAEIHATNTKSLPR